MDDEISSTLSDQHLQKLRDSFDDSKMEGLLTATLPKKHLRTKSYIDVLHKLFHDSVPPAERPAEGRAVIESQDRERCIITLLAARSSQRNLALHIYIGLMLGIQPEEIADIIFLTAVYAGTPAMADGMNVAVKTLDTLASVAQANPAPGVEAVLNELMDFPL